jgi:hypothetical protein
MLPDLDSISGVFNSASVPAAGTGAPASSLGGADVLNSPVKAKGLDEEFNVKEMASAIQTILKREDKG